MNRYLWIKLSIPPSRNRPWRPERREGSQNAV